MKIKVYTFERTVSTSGFVQIGLLAKNTRVQKENVLLRVFIKVKLA